MILKTRGIVLKSIKYSETSLICTVYTEQLGLKKYIVNGVRTAKAKIKPSLLQVMTILDMVVYQKENRELHRINELSPAIVWSRIPFEIKRSSIGLFITEVTGLALKEDEPNEILFELISETFKTLDEAPEKVILQLHLWYMLQLSTVLGFMPNGNWSPATPYFDLKEASFVKEMPHLYCLESIESKYISQLINTELSDLESMSSEGVNKRILIQSLLQYYQYHLEYFKEVKSHKILQLIF